MAQDDTEQIILQTEGSILNGDGDLDGLEGRVVDAPLGASQWKTTHARQKVTFTPSGELRGGLRVFRPYSRP